MKWLFIFASVLFANMLYAHQPDLSSLLIYEQNGKRILLIKSSLTAFEGEVDFHFGKNAYKTPDEFKALVKQRFEKNCQLKINESIIKFNNINVILGHETTIFTELVLPSSAVNSLYLKNTFFKNTPNNQCELVLTLNGLPQKQYILNNANEHAVQLGFVNSKWQVEEPKTNANSEQKLIYGVVFALVAIIVVVITIKIVKLNKPLI